MRLSHINLLILVFIITKFVESASNNNNNGLKNDITFAQFRQTLCSHVPNLFKSSIINPLTNSKKNRDTECWKHLEEFVTEVSKHCANIGSGSKWSLQLIDSWGKIPEGILYGNVNSFGNIEQCLNTKVKHRENATVQFTGKYFAIGWVSRRHRQASSFLFSLPGHIPITGICMPSTCSKKNVKEIGNTLINQLAPFKGKVKLDVIFESGDNEGLKLFDKKGCVIMWSIVMLLLVIAIGTFLDIFYRFLAKENEMNVILRSFSLIYNTEKIFHLEIENTTKATANNSKSGNENVLQCLHAIRFLLSLWVIFTHLKGHFLWSPSRNRNQLSKFGSNHDRLLGITNAYIPMDSFLTISGFLLTYNLLKAKSSPNIWKVYANRFARVSPGYYAITLCTPLILWLAGHESFLKLPFTDSEELCWNQFPSQMMYQNHPCNPYHWYLRTEMQIFYLSALIACLIAYHEKAGILCLSFATIGSVYNAYLRVLSSKQRNSNHTGIYTEYDPLYRAIPYFLGMWAGYIYNKQSHSAQPNYHLSLSPKIIRILWFVTIVCFGGILLARPGYNHEYAESLHFIAIREVVSHTLWGMCTLWIIFSCEQGYAGILGNFLKWKGFGPVGRLSFSAYLVSYHVDIALRFSDVHSRERTVFTFINTLQEHIFWIYLAGYIWCITVELPLGSLFKFILTDVLPKAISSSKNYSLLNKFSQFKWRQNFKNKEN